MSMRDQFEWDENKNKQNIKKHGIDFQDAKTIFSAPMLVKIDDEVEEEDRWVGIGMVRGVAMVVVFTEPGEYKIRIISVRKATKQERKSYEEKIRY